MKKKILKNACYVLGVILVSALIAAGAMYLLVKRNVEVTGNVLGVSWYNETDTEFTIDTVEELYEFAKLSIYYNFKGQTIKLGADLVINEGNAEDWEENAPSKKWTAINGFAGTFDGQGHTISGLYAKGYNAPIALFTNAKGECRIQNFMLTNSYLEGRGFGGVASVVSNGGGHIKQIYSDAIITIKGSYSGNAGGICSKVNVATSMEECWYDGVITNSGRDSGGIVDVILGCKVELSHCLFSGEINCTWDYSGSRTGGFVGRIVNEDAQLSLTDCLSHGTITSGHLTYTGVVLGTAMADTTLVCKDTYAARGEYAAIGNSGFNGTMQSLPLEIVADNLVGYKAYQWTNLDFSNYWSVIENDTPILTCFAETSPSLDGIQKAYDTSWYSEEAGEGVITTREQLYGFYILSGSTDFTGKTVKLGADIVLNDGKTANFSKSEQTNLWFPLNGFAGTFDGQRHTISGMYVNSATRYVGFFGITSPSSVVKNLNLKNSLVINKSEETAPISTGSVAGVARGRFENIYSNATLETSGIYMGGLFGQAYSATTISDCWFDGTVTHQGRYAGGVLGIASDSQVNVQHCLNTGALEIIWKGGFCNSGGIVGSTLGSANVVLTISDCLNVGTITTTTGGTGSVLGHCVKGYANIKDSYALKTSNARDGKGVGYVQGALIGGTGILREELLKGYSAFDWSTLDFENHWSIVLNDTPVLKNFASSSPSVAGRKKAFDMSWYDQKADSYVIKNAKQLYGLYLVSGMTNFKGKTVKLGNNIVLNSDDASTWSAENAPKNKWYPLEEFAGTFDGQGHTISGLYFNGTERYIGFFSKTTVDAVVKNLRLENSKMINHLGGKKLLSTGSIAGAGHGTFDTIYSNVILEVSGDTAGGLLGQVYKKTTVKNCQYDGTFTNVGRYSGGIIGAVTGESVDILHSLNTGTINVTRGEGFVQAGGILGGTYYKEDIVVNITDCFNSGAVVTNQGGTGSVLGHCVLGTVNIKNSYATMESNRRDNRAVGYVQGTVNGTAIQFSGTMLSGLGGYQYTKLNFDKYWAAVADRTPQLQSFTNGALSVAGVKKAFDTSWYDANKSEYVLKDIADLYGFTIVSTGTDFSEKTIKLANNITFNNGDADTFKESEPQKAWLPISKFAGTFDGQGKTIKGLYVPSYNNAGLFSETTDSAVIKNLKLNEAYVCGSTSNGTGSIVGRGGGTFTAIYSDAIVSSVKNSVGGIIGFINADTKMDQVWFAGSATSKNQAGGLAANVKGAEVTFTNCHMSGTVATTAESGHMNLGMFVGMIDAESDVAAIKSLASGYLKPSIVIESNNYARALVGKVTGNNALFHGESVVRVIDEDHIHPYNKSTIGILNPTKDGKKTYTNCGWKGTAGSGIKELSIAQMTGANAMYNFNGIEFCNNAADKSKPWVTIIDNTPMLRIFANATQVVDLTEYVVADTTWYTEAKKGVGSSEDNPYMIEDAGDLLGLSNLVNAGNSFEGCYFKVVKDIEYNKDTPDTLEDWKNYTAKNLFKPIGTEKDNYRFAGIFDGGGNTISGIYVSMTDDERFVGLFGATEKSAEIRNLTLENCYFEGNAQVGSISGRGGGNFENIESNAVLVGTASSKYAGDFVGGMLGMANATEVTVTDCNFSGEIYADGADAGGMIGAVQSSSTATIQNCSVSNLIKEGTAGRAGGIVGGVYKGTLKVTDSSFTGTLTSEGPTVGGIVARVHTDSTATITECTVSGTLECTKATAHSTAVYTGGLIGGVITNSTANITQTSFTGNVLGNENYPGAQIAGGIGYIQDSAASFTEVYVGGIITASQQCGGFVGYAYATKTKGTSVTMTDCQYAGTLYAKHASNDQRAGGLVGRVNGYSTANKVSISATRCLLNGQLLFNRDYDYGCILAGKIEKYADLTSDGVYYVNDAERLIVKADGEDNYLTHQIPDGAAGITVNGIDPVMGLTADKLTDREATKNAGKLQISTVAGTNSAWVAIKDGLPTLRFVADENNIIQVEPNVQPRTAWFDDAKDGVGQSEDNPYVLDGAADLLGLAKLVNDEEETFEDCYVQLKQDILFNDVDMNSQTAWETYIEQNSSDTMNVFNPIGTSEHPFKGHFDGNECTITGLYISSASSSNVGLFGVTDGAEIKDLTLDCSYIKGGNNVGSIVGLGSGTITNVTSDAVVVAANKAGGFIGQVNGAKVTVKDCTFSGEVKATTQCAAGMIGEILDVTEGNKTKIQNCVVHKDAKLTADGSGTSGGRVGGIVGNVGTSHLEVTNSKFEGTIEAQGATLGGIVARVNKNTGSGSHVDITGCTSSGSVTCSGSGNVYVGGLIGGVWEESVADITQCSSTCTVSVQNGNRVSGAVGQLGKSTVNLNEVYVGGTITAKEQCGGFVGRTEGNNATANMTDCHFDGTLAVTTTGWGYAGGLIGYVPGVSGKPHVITATRCLMTGTLQFDTASNYKCILIGNINKYVQFTCNEGVYYINDAKVTSTHKNQSSTGVTVTRVTGTGAVVHGFSATELQGSNAQTNASALFATLSDGSACKWNLPANDTAYPTLKFLNVTK